MGRYFFALVGGDGSALFYLEHFSTKPNHKILCVFTDDTNSHVSLVVSVVNTQMLVYILAICKWKVRPSSGASVGYGSGFTDQEGKTAQSSNLSRNAEESVLCRKACRGEMGDRLQSDL